MTNEVVKLLSEAQELIRDPKNWCQGPFALDAEGVSVSPGSSSACCFCADGAMERVLSDQLDFSTYNKARRVLTDAAFDMGVLGVVFLNETTDHPTVMKMFDLAIELAAQEGAA